MKPVSRHSLLMMAQEIFQQKEFKISASYFSDGHILATVSRLVLMSFVFVQLIDLRSQGHIPDNLSTEEKKICESLFKKCQSPAHKRSLPVFLRKMREQLTQKTYTLDVEHVPCDYSAKTELVKLYDYLLRDSLILHPDCPLFVMKKDIPMQPLGSLFGFHFIEIEIKRLVETNDALSPYFRTLLGIWRKPDALKAPVTVAGLAIQHIDWGGSLSWIGLPTLSILTPPSIKTFVYRPEYEGLVFSADLRDFLIPETRLKPEIENVKKLAAQLLKAHEKLQVALLKEHGLTQQVEREEKESEMKSTQTEKGEEEKDVTLTFAKLPICEISSQHKSNLTPAVMAMDSALNDYLKAANQRVSLATLARRIKNWYEPIVPMFSLEDLLKTLPPPKMSSKTPTRISSSCIPLGSLTHTNQPTHSTASSASSMMSSVTETLSTHTLSSALPQTSIEREAKRNASLSSTNETIQPMKQNDLSLVKEYQVAAPEKTIQEFFFLGTTQDPSKTPDLQKKSILNLGS